MEKLIQKIEQIKEKLVLLKGCHGKVQKQDPVADLPMSPNNSVSSSIDSTMKFDQEGLDFAKAEKIISALDKAGQRESALKLKNWGEMDDVAKCVEKELNLHERDSKQKSKSKDLPYAG